MATSRPDLQLELPLAAAPAGAGGQASLPLDEPPLAFRLRRSRRHGVSLAMDELGLRVDAPRGMALPQIEQAVRKGRRALAGREGGPGRLHLPARWCDGARIPFLGGEVVLRLAGVRDPAVLDDATLFLPLPSGAGERQIKDRTEGWLQQEAARVLGAELAGAACRLGIAVPSWRLSFAAGGWGGVEAAGRLRLSWRLVHLSRDEIRRVLARLLQPLCRRGEARDLWDTDAAPVPA